MNNYADRLFSLPLITVTADWHASRYSGMTNYRIGPHRTTSDHIGSHRITSDQIWQNCTETSATATHLL